MNKLNKIFNMKKSDYIKMLQGVKPTMHKVQENHMLSVTDPSYAQTGRQIITNPLPYETKPIYANGVPLKDMQPFDGMYVDKHTAFQSAKEFSENQSKDIKDKLTKIEEEKKKKNESPKTE